MSQTHPPSTDPVRPAEGYAGDITPATALEWWRNGHATLIDVRSQAEVDWVGFVPEAPVVPWKQWPGMTMNPSFDADLLAAANGGGSGRVVLLCRSGQRSIAAAKRATELGLVAYNILEGFEGDPDANGQRGHLSGWRRRGLPWKQN